MASSENVQLQIPESKINEVILNKLIDIEATQKRIMDDVIFLRVAAEAKINNDQPFNLEKYFTEMNESIRQYRLEIIARIMQQFS